MKVLITGARGQLGVELRHVAPRHGTELVALDSVALDVADADAVAEVLARERPDAIINAAAYTAVDRAETQRERAWAVNADGPAHLAAGAARSGARLIHISTDFVFSGELGRAAAVDRPTSPVNVYGASKAAGEARVRDALGSEALVLRTAWVYAGHGRNFVQTMLRLMADPERESLSVVEDQLGSPTWARSLAEVIWRALPAGIGGVHHFTDAGVASWYDFACAIQDEALALGLLKRRVPIQPIPTFDFPTPARRPSCGVLAREDLRRALSITPEHWRRRLATMLAEQAERAGD